MRECWVMLYQRWELRRMERMTKMKRMMRLRMMMRKLRRKRRMDDHPSMNVVFVIVWCQLSVMTIVEHYSD
jgi:hypothetical protein